MSDLPISAAASIRSRLRPRPVATPTREPPWLVLVVDDDPNVHAMTRVLLRDFTFQGRPFEVLSAHSAAEGRTLLASRPEIPVVLLDIVMETDDAGLRLVHDIREELNNDRLQIILRTGQPGMTPEADVMTRYDVNDYRSKADLSSQKLFTALVGALRVWTHISTTQRLNEDLERRLEEGREARLRAEATAECLIGRIPVPAWVDDGAGMCRLRNSRFRDFSAAFGSDGILAALARCQPVSAGRCERIPVDLVAPDGTPRRMTVLCEPIEGEAGKILGRVGLLIDGDPDPDSGDDD